MRKIQVFLVAFFAILGVATPAMAQAPEEEAEEATTTTVVEVAPPTTTATTMPPLPGGLPWEALNPTIISVVVDGGIATIPGDPSPGVDVAPYYPQPNGGSGVEDQAPPSSGEPEGATDSGKPPINGRKMAADGTPTTEVVEPVVSFEEEVAVETLPPQNREQTQSGTNHLTAFAGGMAATGLFMYVGRRMRRA